MSRNILRAWENQEEEVYPEIKPVTMNVMPSVQFKRGDFITYYDPVVQADCVINVQDWYWAKSLKLEDNLLTYKRWIYYKALNLKRNHLYYDGSRLGIILEEYSPVKYSTPEEIDQYMKALKKEGLTL